MSTAYYLKVLGVLCGFGFVMVVMMRLAKGASYRRFSRDLKLIDRLAVDQGTSLVVVELHEKRYLLGVGGKQISVLDTLER